MSFYGQDIEPNHEKGTALIIVLGLVALISTWAVTAAYEDAITLQRSENHLNAMRAEQASQSLLHLTAKVLREDSRDTKTDDLDEAWAQETLPFPIDDGSAQGMLVDANRYVNLNMLVDGNGVVMAPFEKSVKALFVRLELDAGLVDALIDWMDKDERPHGAAGAESSSYQDKDYVVKNARLDVWDELLLIEGFDGDIVQRLSQVAVVAAVTGNKISTVNVNTATAAVLMSMAPTMTEIEAEAFISQRPFDSVAAALQNRTWESGVQRPYLSVSSDTFMLRTEARFARVVLREKFMLRREAEKITVLSRQRMQHAPVPHGDEEVL